MTNVHEDRTNYVLDQMCLIALTASFGGICLSLYFWQKQMLVLMLADQFHPWILGSGILLAAMAAIRTASVWRSRTGHAPDCCEHDHEHGASCSDHGHEHQWAPWRYVVLLLPVILILLGLPNKGPELQAAPVNLDLTHETTGYATLVTTGVEPWQQLVAAAALSLEPSFEPALVVTFKTLLTAPVDKRERDYWKRKRIRVTGQFQASPTSDRLFNLVGFRIKCCGPDAIPFPVPARCKESISHVRSDQWVQLTARMDFFPLGGNRFATYLEVANSQAIVPTAPDPDAYIAN